MTVVPDTLRAALLELIAAPSWEEKGDVLRRHPEVADTPCLLLITEFLTEARAADSEHAAAAALLTRTLLERFRLQGVELAVAEIAKLAPINATGEVSLSFDAREHLDELLHEELIAISERSDLDDATEAAYARARSEEALVTTDDPEFRALLHLLAGTAWRHLMHIEGVAVAGGETIRHLHAVLALVSAADNPTIFGNAHNELGLVLLDLPGGDQRASLSDAVTSFEAALSVRSRDDQPLKWAATMNNLAMAFTRYRTHDWVERTECAVKYFRAAVTVLARDGGTRDAFRSYLNLGTAHAQLATVDTDHLDHAIDTYTAALAFPQTEIPIRERLTCQLNRARALSVKGEYASARADAGIVLGLITPGVEPMMFAVAQMIVGNTYLASHDTESEALPMAVVHLEQASRSVGMNEAPDLRRHIDSALGDGYLLAGDFASARGSYSSALAAHETLYQAAIDEAGRYQESGTVAGLYDRDAYANLRCRLYEAGLLRLEAGRARAIDARLTLGQIEQGVLDVKQHAVFSELRHRIAALQAELHADPIGSHPTLRSELEETNQRLREFLSEFPATAPQALSLDEFHALAPASGALVYLVVTCAGGAALVVPHGGTKLAQQNVVWLRHLTDAELDEILRGSGGWFDSYFGSAAKWQRAIVTVSRRLWDLAMGPLHDRFVEFGLERGAPVVLVPPAGLSVLPLHAASNGTAEFGDEWTVSYVPSGFTLATCCDRVRTQAGHREGLLVVNPTGDLPGSVREADAVASLLGPVMRLEGAAATPAEVSASLADKAYVHFACHGAYSWSDPLQSKLKLAGGELTLANVLGGIDLTGTRLVALSACETGMTDLAQSPDDYIGLPSGFLQAGAAAVLSALWRIDDVATAALVEHFYAAHLGEGQLPADALRTAVRRLRQVPAYDHPYFWAGFILTGV